MKTIYRYEIIEDINKVSIPHGGKVLYVDICYSEEIQHKIPCIWVEVDTDSSLEERTFAVVGTGADIEFLDGYSHKYIGTAIEKNKYAFHIYEVFYYN